MSASYLTALHQYLRRSRFATATDTYPPQPKRYPRMRQIALGAPPNSAASFIEALRMRASADAFKASPLPFGSLSLVFASLRMHRGSHRPYPSGGSLFPIETYLCVENVESLDRGVYHYRPDTHALEFLWPSEPGVAYGALIPNETLRDAGAFVVCTAHWERSTPTYKDFAFELALIESGHLGQNILLAAAVSGIAARPLGGFVDEAMTALLDIDDSYEQPVYVIALGTEAHTP